MSITLGVYDIFAYTVPGFLYMYVFNEFLKAIGWKYWDMANLPANELLPYYGLVLIGLAYLIGHTMEYVSFRLWVQVFYPKSSGYKAYEEFLKRYPDLKVTFKPEQAPLLFNIIRQNHYHLAVDIEKSKVICVMLRNISFALFLLFLVSIYLTFKNSFYYPSLITSLTILLGSIITIRRGASMNEYYFLSVYENAAIYGKSLTEILSKGKVGDGKQSEKEKKLGSKE